MGMCVDKEMDVDKNLPGERLEEISLCLFFKIYLYVEELWVN